MTRAASVAFVLAVSGGILLVTGVSAGELALFALFEVGFVLLPGLVAYRALRREAGDLLQQVAVGAGVGHALLLAGFIATAALGARWALWILPAAALAGAGFLAYRDRGWFGGGLALSGRQAVALSAVAVAAVGLLAVQFFTQAPLPGTRASISYYPDLMWALGFAGEALHHWPLTVPHVAGEPLRYHTFAFMEIASVTQVTGIDLPVVSLRLFPASLVLLLAVQLCHAGRRFTGKAWAGPVAAGLVLLVGDLDLGTARPEPLGGLYFSSLFLSASQLLGMVVFLAVLDVIADLLETDRRQLRVRSLALLALLLFACSGAKASLLPVLIGGLVVFALWRRRVTAGWIATAGLCAAGFLVSYALQYSGNTRGPTLDPLRSALRSYPGQNLQAEIGDHLTRLTAYPLATAVTAVALLAPLAGLAFSRISLRSPSLPQAWLLGLAVTSLVAFFALDLPGFSQLYFLWFGYCAAAILAAGGLVEAVRRWPSDKRRRGLGFIGLGVAAGVLLGLAPTGTGLPLVKAYMGLAVALAAVAAASAAGLLRGASWPAVVAVVALLTAGLLDAPADRLPDIASRALADDEAVHREADPVRERGLSIPLAEGLRWVRDHTDEDALLAVDNHLRRVASGESRFYYYSALSERRVYLESWDFTDQVLASGVETGFNPFPARLALNDSVYTGKGGRAAAALKRRGVDYVLVDRVNAPPPSNHIPGRVVFRNDALVVYRL